MNVGVQLTGHPELWVRVVEVVPRKQRNDGICLKVRGCKGDFFNPSVLEVLIAPKLLRFQRTAGKVHLGLRTAEVESHWNQPW